MPVNTDGTVRAATEAAAAGPRRARRGRPRARSSRAAAAHRPARSRPAARAAGARRRRSASGARNSASASTRPASSSAAASSAPPSTQQRGHLARARAARAPPRARRPSSGLDPGGRRAARPAGATRTTGELAARLRQPAAGAEAAAAVEHDAQRQALGRRLDVARQQLGVVRERRAAADGDGVELRPPGVHERPALGRGDPAALARARGDAAVERRGQLEQHERAAAHDVRAEGGVLAAGARLERAAGELDLRRRPRAGARGRGRRPRDWDRRWRRRRARCPPPCSASAQGGWRP